MSQAKKGRADLHGFFCMHFMGILFGVMSELVRCKLIIVSIVTFLRGKV